jgi:uncharacterized protein
MRYLLDVNVWVAMLDEAHVFHSAVIAFIEQPNRQIATCPLVENGILRILNLPSYGKYGAVGFDAVRNKVRENCTLLDHEFWPDDISLQQDNRVHWPRVIGHQQITDVYLLALAVAHQGCLATLDHRVSLSTVVGAQPQHLQHL